MSEQWGGSCSSTSSPGANEVQEVQGQELLIEETSTSPASGVGFSGLLPAQKRIAEQWPRQCRSFSPKHHFDARWPWRRRKHSPSIWKRLERFHPARIRRRLILAGWNRSYSRRHDTDGVFVSTPPWSVSCSSGSATLHTLPWRRKKRRSEQRFLEYKKETRSSSCRTSTKKETRSSPTAFLVEVLPAGTGDDPCRGSIPLRKKQQTGSSCRDGGYFLQQLQFSLLLLLLQLLCADAITASITVTPSSPTVATNFNLQIDFSNSDFDLSNDEIIVVTDCADPERWLFPVGMLSATADATDASTQNTAQVMFTNVQLGRGDVDYKVCWRRPAADPSWQQLGSFSVVGGVPELEIVTCVAANATFCVLQVLATERELNTTKGIRIDGGVGPAWNATTLPGAGLIAILDGQADCTANGTQKTTVFPAPLLVGSGCSSLHGLAPVSGAYDDWASGAVFGFSAVAEHDGVAWRGYRGFAAPVTNSACDAGTTTENGFRCARDEAAASVSACAKKCSDDASCKAFDYNFVAGADASRRCRIISVVPNEFSGGSGLTASSQRSFFVRQASLEAMTPKPGSIFTLCACRTAGYSTSTSCETIDDFSILKGYLHIEGPRFGPSASPSFGTFFGGTSARTQINKNSALTNVYTSDLTTLGAAGESSCDKTVPHSHVPFQKSCVGVSHVAAAADGGTSVVRNGVTLETAPAGLGVDEIADFGTTTGM